VRSLTEQKRSRRRLPAAERRAAILDAALDAFADNGFHQTSLEAVAERAAISKALIYEHFESKRDLHRALLETYVHELLSRVIAATEAAEPGEVRLRAGAEAFLGFVEKRREAWRMLVRNPEEPGVAELVGRLQGEAAEAIAELMQAEVPRQRRDDPAEARLATEMLAEQLVGALRALGNWWDDHREVPREKVLAMLMEFAWLGFDRLSRGERWPPSSPAGRPRSGARSRA
jgi:AcrR family transcriptional regulator